MTQGLFHPMADVEPQTADFGCLCWHVNGDRAPGTGMTLGEVTIEAGASNPLHLHDNAEEVLYLIEGALEHRVGDEWFTMGPGDVVRVPMGVKHQGRNVGDTAARMVVAYNHPHRTFIVVEDE